MPKTQRIYRKSLTEKKHLESRALQLMQDNKTLTQTCQQVSRQRELEVAELQAQLSKVRERYHTMPGLVLV